MASFYLVDMDGTTFDMQTPALRLFGVEHTTDLWKPGEWSLAEKCGVTEDEFWRRIDECPSFWRSLPLLPWAHDLIHGLLDRVGLHNVYFCSSPSRHPSCVAGKLASIQRHFPHLARHYIFTPHKHLLAGPDRVLIDDSRSHVQRFRANGGRAILVPRAWNTPHHYLPDDTDMAEHLLNAYPK